MIIGGLIILICLFAVSAFFSSAETAMFSLNALTVNQIRTNHPAKAALVEMLLAKPTSLLSTILIGNTLVNVAASALGFSILRLMHVPHSEAVAVPVMTIALLITGEVIPKRIAMRHAPAMASAYAVPLFILMRILTPARYLLDHSTKLFEHHLSKPRKGLNEEEFLTAVELGEETGVLNEEERTMVDGIIRLEETQASDIMTPRVDLVGIDLDDPHEEQIAGTKGCRFHFLPLYRETMDQIEGFLDVPRFLLNGGTDFSTSIIKPYYVPENVPLDTLLTTFQRENRRIAIVADEFGGTAGLITRGDVLEEIADDVENEFGETPAVIQQTGPNIWLIAGSTSLEDINYELDLELEAEGADRIAGWITAQLEHIPKAGETATAQGVRVTVERVRRQRIMMAQLEKIPANKEWRENEEQERAT
ncbi:MAG: hemolysin family protein [Kiritimatiellia bacterium]